MSTTPWPSRTDTPPLAFPLNVPRSESRDDKQPSSVQQKTTLHVIFHSGGAIKSSLQAAFNLFHLEQTPGLT